MAWAFVASQQGGNGKEMGVLRNKCLRLYNENWVRPQILVFLTSPIHFIYLCLSGSLIIIYRKPILECLREKVKKEEDN